MADSRLGYPFVCRAPAADRGLLGGALAAGAAPGAFSATWALFLDVDGTLVDIADRPDAIVVDAALKELLRGVYRATSGALALISGRPVRDIDRFFAPLRLPMAGQHGAERRSADGTMHFHTPLLERLHEAGDSLSRFAAQYPGLIFESKGMSIALHYRLAPQLREAAQAQVRDLAARLRPEYELQEGKQVLELKPSGRDKGTAIEEFMHEPPFAGRMPVFVGDDLTDEFGFACVNRLGGHTVKVGPGASVATWRIADASAVRHWLRSGVGEARDEAGKEQT